MPVDWKKKKNILVKRSCSRNFILLGYLMYRVKKKIYVEGHVRKEKPNYELLCWQREETVIDVFETFMRQWNEVDWTHSLFSILNTIWFILVCMTEQKIFYIWQNFLRKWLNRSSTFVTITIFFMTNCCCVTESSLNTVKRITELFYLCKS